MGNELKFSVSCFVCLHVYMYVFIHARVYTCVYTCMCELVFLSIADDNQEINIILPGCLNKEGDCAQSVVYVWGRGTVS